MGSWCRSACFLGLALAALMLQPAPAASNEKQLAKAQVIDHPTQPGRSIVALDLTVYLEGTEQATPAQFEQILDWTRDVLRRGARLLYESTQGELFLRNITLTTSSDLKEQADIVFSDASGGATAGVEGFFNPVGTEKILLDYRRHFCGTRASGAMIVPANAEVYEGIFTSCSDGDRASAGLVHEFGHYLFGLEEEYDGKPRVFCNMQLFERSAATGSEDGSLCVSELGGTCLPPERCVDADGVPLTGLDLWECQARENKNFPEFQTSGTYILPAGCGENPPAGDACIREWRFEPISAAELVVTLTITAPEDYAADARRGRLECPPGSGNTIRAGAKGLVGFQVYRSIFAQEPITEDDPNVDFTDNRNGSLSWTIRNLKTNPGKWVARFWSKTDCSPEVQLRYELAGQNCTYGCSGGPGARSACQPGIVGSQSACLMDAGTSRKNVGDTRNRRTDFCFRHLSQAGDAARHYPGDNSLLTQCTVARFVTLQELYNHGSCWETIANSRFRKQVVLGMTDAEVEATKEQAPTAKDLARTPYSYLLGMRSPDREPQSGTVRIATANQLTPTASFPMTVGRYDGRALTFTSGNLAGRSFAISSNDTRSFNFTAAFPAPGPQEGDAFVVAGDPTKLIDRSFTPSESEAGVVQTATGGRVTATADFKTQNVSWVGGTLSFTSGPEMGRGYEVTAQNGATLSVQEAWQAGGPQAGDSFVVRAASKFKLPATMEPTFAYLGKTEGTAPAGVPAGLTASNVLEAQPAYVVAVDASGSMSRLVGGGSLRRVDIALGAALDVANLLRDNEFFGALGFSDDTAVDWLQRSSYTGEAENADNDRYLPRRAALVRADFMLDAAIDKRDTLLPSGSRTALGDALQKIRLKLDQFDDADVSSKTVFLFSDGNSNIGKSLDSELAALTATERLTVHTVGLGEDANLRALEKIARVTGGTFFYAPDEEALRPLVPRLMAAARGERELLSIVERLDAGDTLELDARSPAFVDQLTFVMASAAADDLELTVIGPGEDEILDTDDDVTYDRDFGGSSAAAFRASATQQSLQVRIAQNLTGLDWKVKVRNGGAGAVTFSLQILARFARLTIDVGVQDQPATVQFPKPIIVEAYIGAPRPIIGLDVSMTVTHPGSPGGAFKPRTITMVDDGSVRSGDQRALDGIYTAMFHDYEAPPATGDDIYLIQVVAENRFDAARNVFKGAVVMGGDGVPDAQPVRLVEGFELTKEACAIVTGVPASGPRPGVVAVRPDPGVLPTTHVVDDLAATPVLSFRLAARDEALFLEQLILNMKVRSSTTDIVGLGPVGLYADIDGDGQVDNPLLPLARADPVVVDKDTGDYLVTFEGRRGEDAIVLLTGLEDQHFLVTFGQAGSPLPGIDLTYASSTATSMVLFRPQPAPRPQPPLVPIVLLVSAAAFLLVLTHRLGGARVMRQCATFGFVAMLFVVTLAVGCGGGGGTPPGQPREPLKPLPPFKVHVRPPPRAIGNYELTLDVSQGGSMPGIVVTSGRTDEDGLPVEDPQRGVDLDGASSAGQSFAVQGPASGG